ncbi:MAG TPA: GYD domain-containing protein [Blastocatellia bacterium]|nr:GYD domain-containing protein [Blastocatellia bacterium]
MPKYLIQGNYGAEGTKGLIKEGGSSRRAAVEEATRNVGGKVEAFYYAFGETDVFVIADLPDNITAAALSMSVNASGAVAVKATALLTVEDVDEASKKTLNYRAPGK